MAATRLLMVEGWNDEQVIDELLKQRNFQPKITVKGAGGYDTLIKQFSALLVPGGDRFGILVDADADIGSRWRSIRERLEQAGYVNLPPKPDPAGTVIAHDDLPRIGLWIMPDNVLPGMLEDYMTFLVPPGDPLFELAAETIDGIPLSERRFAEIHRSKALLHTWLAWQRKPGQPLGVAITKKYFQSGVPQVTAFLSWLSRLFD